MLLYNSTVIAILYAEHFMHGTVPLYNITLFISRSYLILVLTTVLGRPCHPDNKNDVGVYYFPIKCDAKIPKLPTQVFFKFYWYYDLNLGRYLNSE